MRSFSLLVFILLSTLAESQTIEDAIRYSLFQPSSTARSVSIAGAFGPLGADISVASTNPAGIAEFRKSEFTLSFGVPMTSTNASLGSSSTSDKKTSFGLDNLAAVFFYDPPSFQLHSFNLAIGINKIADFNRDFTYSGTSAGTIVERFLEQATGNTPDELDALEAGPAFDAGAIYNFDGGTEYLSDFITLDEEIFRRQSIERSGYIQEIFFTLATNIKNKLSLGFTLGLPIVSFTETKIYTERDDLNTVDFFEELGFTEELSSSGIGVNLKFGFIYKITPKIRIGGAFHSPSWYFIADQYATLVDYTLTNNAGQFENYQGFSPLNEIDYRFATPWRALFGFGYIYDLGDLKGFFSAEAEYVDYSSGSFNLTSDSNDPFSPFIEGDLNSLIKNDFSSAFNLKAGTELAYKKARLRLGGVLNQSLYVNSGELDFDPGFSVGLGFRGNKRYIDLAYSLTRLNGRYSPYRLLDQNFEQSINYSTNVARISVTYGSKF